MFPFTCCFVFVVKNKCKYKSPNKFFCCIWQSSISDAIEALDNAAMSSFVIRNDANTSSPSQMVDVWSAWVQLNLSDGTLSRDQNPYTVYRYAQQPQQL